MKGIWAVIAAVILCGCSSTDREMEEALAIRSRLLSSDLSFRCAITAEYEEKLEEFTLDCAVTGDALSFTVAEPESIGGITGEISGGEGALTFDGEILAFPLMADGRISPVSAPWLMVTALRSGYITACGREGDGLHLTVDESYADDALTLDIRTDAAGAPVSGEISFRGRRVLSLRVENFSWV